MSGSLPRALVVGDRFIEADHFAGSLEAAANAAGIGIQIDRLQINYPSVDSVALPTTASASPPRPMWEDPVEVAARTEADFAADPTIREYTGPVDLLEPHLPGVDVLLLHLAPLSAAAIAAADRLQAVGCARGGAINLNMEHLNERGIPVFNCPGRNAQAVAEYIMGAVLSLKRGIAAGRAGISAGQWRLDLYTNQFVGPEYAGRICGLIGFGGVGRAFAPIARGFGMRLLVHDPYVSETDIAEAGAEMATLDEVLSLSDIVVLAARLTNETRSMIGARELAMMRPDATFVNPARAELVDGDALRDVLARRAIAGAVVDVFSPEPLLSNDPLLSMDHVLLTPHIAGATLEAGARGADVVCKRVVAFLASGRLDESLNRKAVEAVQEKALWPR